MKILKCNKCHELKQEIEFEYIYFNHKYNKICKDCQNLLNLLKINKKI